MKTKTIELYEFKELPKDVQKKVLDNQRDINVDYNWYQFALDEWKDELEKLGFDNPEISFSGFWSQGDGASFTCKNVDVIKFLKSQKKLQAFPALIDGLNLGVTEVYARVVRIDYHYSHENTVRPEVEVLCDEDRDDKELQYKQGDMLQGLLRSFVTAKSREIYRALEKEYEYLTSDEEVKETILANEYTFTIDGKMEN